MPWYSYNPGAQDVSNPNNYTLVGSTPPSCPNPNNFLCAIQAADNGGFPILFLIWLIIEIANAINNRTESTNVRLRPTP
ncbi:hypothetical protein ACR780_09170 [Sphingobacterium faecium]|uniref:hypothetical protein n=1 Tax=Sphingobacterium faecium TaxID=34087 RepID=UPI003DA4BDD5